MKSMTTTTRPPRSKPTSFPGDGRPNDSSSTRKLGYWPSCSKAVLELPFEYVQAKLHSRAAAT
jgi:hypothetical protein